MDYQEGETDGNRQKRIRKLLKEQISIGKAGKKPQKIQIKVLKNRNGSKGDTVIDFFPMFNMFTEKGQSGVTHTKEEIEEEAGEWEALEPVDSTDLPFN